MRQLNSHKCGVLNSDLVIDVCDEPGHGGAHHKYAIGYNLNPGTSEGGVHHVCMVQFQNGTVKDEGFNGITNEALLAIAEDRLRCFQAGPFHSVDNAEALIHVREALASLHNRTRNRIERGVEGTYQL